MPISVVSHPLVQAKLTELRNKSTPAYRFRSLMKELSTILGIEASREIGLKDVQVESPMASFTGKDIAPRVGISPILRAGIGMTDAFLELFPAGQVFYLGLYREKVSLAPVEYYQKLPKNVTVDTLYLLDPLIATGGTAIAAISILLDWGLDISRIKLVSILGSKPGMAKVQEAYPGLDIVVGGVDETLSEDGMILPGLGDSGDRLFNTLH
ncbi:hypothetical protein JCM10213_009193 [Rhodosporidiobolus nylandii]